MRFAFWRKRVSEGPFPQQETRANHAAYVATPSPEYASASSPGDIDLRDLGHTLWRRKLWVLVPTLCAAVLALVAVNSITPRYKSESRILIDGRENVFLRPSGDRSEDRNNVDPEAVTSQVQLILSRDLAKEVIRKEKLADDPEFDPLLRGITPLKAILSLIGIGRDLTALTPEERVIDSYFERLTAYAVDKSRVISVEFQSENPELAARVANAIAEGYLSMQLAAKQEQAKSASAWLAGEIETLRAKVGEAESKAEAFRSQSNLFIGPNNTSLSHQQLGELNTQLSNAQALKSDAETKSRLIREMLNSGRPIEASEILNSELVRRLSEQRVTLRAQLAEQSSTLLGNHPRIKELRAQLQDLDRQLRDEASKISRSLENDARIAGGRVDALRASLDQVKRQASSNNSQDVQLRALEREAKAQRDLLESYLAKFREVTTRENIDAAPSDGRIISRASPSRTPAYPKKLPIIVIATLGTMMLFAGGIVSSELLRMTAPLQSPQPQTVPRTAAPAQVARQPRYRVAPDQIVSAPPEAPVVNVTEQSVPQPVTALPVAPVSAPVQQKAPPPVARPHEDVPVGRFKHAVQDAPNYFAHNYAASTESAATRSTGSVRHVTPLPPISPVQAVEERSSARSGGADRPVEARPDIADLEALADAYSDAGGEARKITVLGAGHEADVTDTALQLARLLAEEHRVVLVDLSAARTHLAECDDQTAPGLVEMLNETASFASMITRDRKSDVHIVNSGGVAGDRTPFNSPRLPMVLDALCWAYDHVVINAGNAVGLPSRLLSSDAQAVLVCRSSMSTEECAGMHTRLMGVGFSNIALLKEHPVDQVPGKRNSSGAKGASAVA